MNYAAYEAEQAEIQRQINNSASPPTAAAQQTTTVVEETAAPWLAASAVDSGASNLPMTASDLMPEGSLMQEMDGGDVESLKELDKEKLYIALRQLGYEKVGDRVRVLNAAETAARLAKG